MEEFVCAGGDVAAEETEEGVEDDNDGSKSATIAGGEKA